MGCVASTTTVVERGYPIGTGSATKGTGGAVEGDHVLDGAFVTHGMATSAAGATIVRRDTAAALVQLEANTAMVRVGIVAFVAHGEE